MVWQAPWTNDQAHTPGTETLNCGQGPLDCHLGEAQVLTMDKHILNYLAGARNNHLK